MPTFSNDSINSPVAAMQLDDVLAWAIQQAWDGGEDSFQRPTLIADNQAQHLTNIFVRDNYEARTRPGTDSIPTVNTSIAGNAVAAMVFGNGVISAYVPSAAGIAAGAVVTGTNIAPGTTVISVGGFSTSQATTTLSSPFAITDTTMAVTSATGIIVGMTITGTNLAAGTKVTIIAGTTITFTPAATGTSSGSYTFSPTITLSLATTGASSGNYTFSFSGITNVSCLRYFETQNFSQLLATGSAGSTPKFLDFSGGAWTDLSTQWAPSASNDTVAIVQGIDKAWITDGVQNFQTWNGANIVDQGDGFTGGQPTTGNFAPTGCTILCWHTSRLFAAGIPSARDTIYVSLLDPSGTPPAPSSGTGDWNLTTRSFRLGNGDGDPVVAMASMQTTVICIWKRNSVWLVNTDPINDAAFTTGIQGFTAAAIPGNIGYGIGIVGRDAWAAYGNDLIFMAQDGVRSVQRMQAAAGQWQLTAPLSQPIQPYIQRINQSAWSGIVGKSYLEFVFFFVPLDNSTVNNTVLVYNARSQRWMGVWTNWIGNCTEVTRFAGLVRFVFGDNTGKVNQWKDTNSNTDDATYFDNLIGYPTQVWTKSYQFGDPICTKTGYNLITRFTAGNATVQFSWIQDLSQVQQWTGTFQPTGDILGVDVLPFLLASTAPTLLPNGIRGLVDFNEGYLKIETSTGWYWLRSVAASAFPNPLREDYG